MVNLNIQLPDSFFDEEIRDGYAVSTEMKKVWAVELDLLNEFQRVCKKYNIHYYAAGGTILGAVRHKGFIPWDDDIDIMMMRDEYTKLCKIAPEEFHHPYFFQTEDTDPGSYRGHAQLRNSNTTGILKTELQYKKKINQGIFIDIFPLDNIPDEENERMSFFKQTRKYRRQYKTYLRRSYPYKYKFNKKIWLIITDYLLSHITPSSYARKKCEQKFRSFEEYIISYNGKPTKKLLLSPICQKRFVVNRCDLSDELEIPFEMLRVVIPSGYENILRNAYGNWKEFVVGTSVHKGVVFDADHSYKDYISSL